VPNVDLVVDTTANPTVAAKLERQRRLVRDAFPPIATVTIGHTAERGVAALSLKGATGGGADILRRLGLAARADTMDRLDDILEDLFPNPPRAVLFQPEPGCSEPTFVGSASQVTALASHLFTGILSALASHTLGTPGEPMSAYIVRLNLDSSTLPRSADHLAWANDFIVHDHTTGYEIRISPAALARIHEECRNGSRRHGRIVETGGPLFGEIDDACRIVWVTEARKPPTDSQQSSEHFQLGMAGVRELSAQLDIASGGAIRFIGAWHTHPDDIAQLSESDKQAMARLVGADGHAPYQALVMILGGSPADWSDWLVNRNQPSIYVQLVKAVSQ
jgi:hypothetical protein